VGEKRARWEQWTAAALIRLDCLPAHEAEFDADQANLVLPRVQVAHVRATPQTLLRTRAQVARRPAGAVSVFLPLAGMGGFRDGNSDRSAGPGQVIVVDADRPFERRFPHRVSEIVIKIPSLVYRDSTGHDPAGVSRLITARPRSPEADLIRTLARLLRQAIGATRAAPHGAPAAAAGPDNWSVESIVLDVVTRLVGGRPDHRARIGLAQSFVEHHLDDPDLSAGRIAAAAGVSERQLSRLFADDGTTVPRYVLTRRLVRAHEWLETGDLPVAQVARSAGFASPSYFARVFKACYAITPSDVRDTGQQQARVEAAIGRRRS
jgi:AraC-like DNA-binding protein